MLPQSWQDMIHLELVLFFHCRLDLSHRSDDETFFDVAGRVLFCKFYLELLEVVPFPVGEKAVPGIAIIRSPSSPSVSGRVSLYDLFFVPTAGEFSGIASSTTGSVKYSRAFPIRIAEPFFKLISAALP